MDPEKLERLEAAGWKAGSVELFLRLSPVEADLVETRLNLRPSSNTRNDIGDTASKPIEIQPNLIK